MIDDLERHRSTRSLSSTRMTAPARVKAIKRGSERERREKTLCIPLISAVDFILTRTSIMRTARFRKLPARIAKRPRPAVSRDGNFLVQGSSRFCDLVPRSVIVLQAPRPYQPNSYLFPSKRVAFLHVERFVWIFRDHPINRDTF